MFFPIPIQFLNPSTTLSLGVQRHPINPPPEFYSQSSWIRAKMKILSRNKWNPFILGVRTTLESDMHDRIWEWGRAYEGRVEKLLRIRYPFSYFWEESAESAYTVSHPRETTLSSEKVLFNETSRAMLIQWNFLPTQSQPLCDMNFHTSSSTS